jgi:hypothetical protein
VKLEDFKIPPGYALRDIHEFIRWGAGTNRVFKSAYIVERFGADITSELLACGLIEPDEYEDGWYRLSAHGLRFATTKRLPRISRAKADEKIAALLTRVRAINVRPDLLYRVVRLHAFGSYITDAPDLGDIDLAYELRSRQAEIEQAGGDWGEILWAHGKGGGTARPFYSYLKVVREIKGRDPYLTPREFAELEDLGITQTVPLFTAADEKR